MYLSYMKASFYVYSLRGEKYLHMGDCFEDMLWQEYGQAQKYKNEAYNVLHSAFDGHTRPQNIVFTLFGDNLSIDFDFAKTLNILETLGVGCFKADSKIGEAFKEILIDDYYFVVTSKCYITPEDLQLDLVVCHEDYRDELLRDLQSREVWM